MRRIYVVLSFVALACARDLSAQAFRIVVHESNTTASMPSAEVAQLFMKKKTTWSSGAPVVPVDQTASSSTRGAFSAQVLHKDLNGIKLYWQQQMFAGRGNPPEEKPSDAAVLAFVKENPGAVGYVSAEAATAGVKVLIVH